MEHHRRSQSALSEERRGSGGGGSLSRWGLSRRGLSRRGARRREGSGRDSGRSASARPAAGSLVRVEEIANPIQEVLPRVIDTTQRVLIASGEYDMELPTLGTLLGIQNMTWGGKLGFQYMPGNESIVIDLVDLGYMVDVYVESGFAGYDSGQGVMGTQHFERGLMWGTTLQSGHMQPQFQPRVSYRHLQWLLGRIDKL